MGLLRKVTNRALWALPSSGTIRGYDSAELVDSIRKKTLTTQEAGAWPELDGAATVLDFGGSFGLHYRRAASQFPGIRWAIVETPETIARATRMMSNNLRFFASVDEARDWLGSVDAVHSNAALQFTEEPELYLAQLCSIQAPLMIWNRILLSADTRHADVQISLLAENGPGLSFSRKRVETARIFIPESAFFTAHAGYTLAKRTGSQNDRSGEDFIFTKSA